MIHSLDFLAPHFDPVGLVGKSWKSYVIWVICSQFFLRSSHRNIESFACHNVWCLCKGLSGWWLGHPSEKYEFVNWDDHYQYMGKWPKWQPNHQPVILFSVGIPGSDWMELPTTYLKGLAVSVRKKSGDPSPHFLPERPATNVAPWRTSDPGIVIPMEFNSQSSWRWPIYSWFHGRIHLVGS